MSAENSLVGSPKNSTYNQIVSTPSTSSGTYTKGGQTYSGTPNTPKKTSGGQSGRSGGSGGGNIISNPSSPTGYSDTKGNPVSVAPTQTQQKKGADLTSPTNEFGNTVLGKIVNAPKNALTPYLNNYNPQSSGSYSTWELGSSNTPGNTGGLFLLTPSEASNYTGTQPVWGVESPNTAVGMASAINFEAPFINSVPVINVPQEYQFSGQTSKGAYEYNTANINIAKSGYRSTINYQNDLLKIGKEFQTNPESFRGSVGFTENSFSYPNGTKTEYGLTQDYFKTLSSYKDVTTYQNMFDDKGFMKQDEYNKFLGNARTSWNELPSDVKRSSRLSGITISANQAVGNLISGTTEFAFSLGVQTKNKDQLNSGVSNDYSFLVPSSTKASRNIPSEFKQNSLFKNPIGYTKELISERPGAYASGATSFTLIAPMVVSGGIEGIKNIKSYGWKEGAIETSSMFSPLRPNAVQFPKPTGEINGFMTETKLPNNIFKQEFTGYNKLGNVKVKSTQSFKSTPEGIKSIGLGETTVTTPELRYIGGNIYLGSRSTVSQSQFLGEGLGNAFTKEGYVGMGSKVDVLSQPFFRMSYQPQLNLVEADLLQSNVWLKTKAGGSRFDVGKNIFTFRGGTRTPKYTTAYEKVTGGDYLTNNFYYYPSGYNVKVGIKGIGQTIDLSQESSISSYITKGKKSSFTTDISKVQVPKTVTSIKQMSNVPSFTTEARTIPKGEGRYTGNEQIPLSVYDKGGVGEFGFSPTSSQYSEMTTVIYGNTLGGIKGSNTLRGFDVLPKGRGGNRLSPIVSGSLIDRNRLIGSSMISDLQLDKVSKSFVQPSFTKTTFNSAQGLSQGLSQVQIQKQIQAQSLVQSQTTAFPTFETPNFGNPGIIPPFAFPPGGEFGLNRSSKLFKGSQRLKYTPSYGALLFKQYGKASKSNTGLGFRPITKGFTWSYNKPKKLKGMF